VVIRAKFTPNFNCNGTSTRYPHLLSSAKRARTSLRLTIILRTHVDYASARFMYLLTSPSSNRRDWLFRGRPVGPRADGKMVQPFDDSCGKWSILVLAVLWIGRGRRRWQSVYIMALQKPRNSRGSWFYLSTTFNLPLVAPWLPLGCPSWPAIRAALTTDPPQLSPRTPFHGWLGGGGSSVWRFSTVLLLRKQREAVVFRWVRKAHFYGIAQFSQWPGGADGRFAMGVNSYCRIWRPHGANGFREKHRVGSSVSQFHSIFPPPCPAVSDWLVRIGLRELLHVRREASLRPAAGRRVRTVFPLLTGGGALSLVDCSVIW